ncbi:uncharacterized protein HGUI_00231 [Hanseniaspora guilliermondii]|uniref:Uncharacterized protein n=1 Tax=Hanseniaspora guilliermondii TaxID=56406 RepID=A0A1L0CTG8_9ASCO|nr:uncharacterized protein HGUI_00231 [Hanseniaspora guilliermondii]
MNNIIELFSFQLRFEASSILESTQFALEIQNNYTPIQLTDDLALEIDINPYNIQLLLIDHETHVHKPFAFSNVHHIDTLIDNLDMNWFIALFIKYIATKCNNENNNILSNVSNKQGKRKSFKNKFRPLHHVFSTNFKLSTFSIDKHFEDGILKVSFNYVLPEMRLFKIPIEILNQLTCTNQTLKNHNIHDIDMKSLFNKRLENYTIEKNKSNMGIDDESKKKLYPLVLYSYQEKTVNWIIKKENEPLEELTIDSIKADPLIYLNKSHTGYVYLGNRNIVYNTITNYIMSTSSAVEYVNSEYLQFKKNLESGCLKGYSGIIAEDMSLGKTVEIIAAIILNKLSDEQITNYNRWLSINESKDQEVKARNIKGLIRSNLVVCTDMILKQWVDSFNSFATSLDYKVLHYKGFKDFQKQYPKTTLKDCAEIMSGYDIVITSYAILKAELPYVEFADNKMNTSRKTRRAPQERFDYSSPLCSVTFFRAIFDESQSLSQASLSSLLKISRIHTWAISATPLKFNDLNKNISELSNLLKCLRIHPFDFPNLKVSNFQCISDWIFDVNSNKNIVEEFVDTIIGLDIARRHTREYVQSQLNIPEQHKFLLPVYLTPIEREVYNQVYENYYAEFHDNRYFNDEINVLNNYLTDLTIMCMAVLSIHDYKRRNGIFNEAFYLANQKHNPEDSMSMILSNLIEANKRALALEIRKYIDLYVQNSRYLIEKEKRFGLAEPILLNALKIIDDNSLSKEDFDDSLSLSLIRHSVLFFLGDCYYNLGLSTTSLDDDSKRKYQEKENLFYDEAAKMRKSILQEQIAEVERSLVHINDESFLKPPTINEYPVFLTEEMEETFIKNMLYMAESGLTSSKSNLFLSYIDDDLADEYNKKNRKINTYYTQCLKCITELLFEQDKPDFVGQRNLLNEIKLERFSTKIPVVDKILKVYFNKINPLLIGISKCIETLNKQCTLLNRLYFDIIELLNLPIIPLKTDETEVDPEKPSEYEKSLEAQQDITFKIELIELILSNRLFITSGSSSKRFVVPQHFEAYEKEGYFVINLLDTWYEHHTSFLNYTAVDKNLAWKSVEFIMKKTPLSQESDFHHEWKDRLKELNKVFNKKINYYKSLQQISDRVLDFDDIQDQDKIVRINNNFDYYVASSESVQRRLKSKDVYLNNLAALQKGEDNKCLICLDYIENGSILECGHRFCRDCIQHWLKTSSTCALCKMPCSQLEVHDFYIDINPNNTKKRNMVTDSINVLTETLNGYKVYDELDLISKLKIPDSNYGAKIDTLIRLLKFMDLKDENNGYDHKSQIIIYTRFPKIIPTLEKILFEFGYQCIVALDNKMKGSNIDRFKKNKDIRILIMTTNDNAGLTLVNANLLILFDPILQSSVESQAINRISRIGQTRETYVFNFVTMNTVEENIIRYKQHLFKQSNKLQNSVDTVASTVDSMTKSNSLKRHRNGLRVNTETQALHIEFLKNCLFNDFKES